MLFAGAFVVLWLNEGKALATANALWEVGKAVISLPGAMASPENEGRLIHLTGNAETAETLVDDLTGVAANAVKLQREAEMYQWVESSQSKTREKLGGSKETVTTYTYQTKWSSRAYDSSGFKEPEGHANPEIACSYTEFAANTVSLGEFLLTPALIGKIRATEYLAATLRHRGGLRPLPLRAALAQGLDLPPMQAHQVLPDRGPWPLRVRVLPLSGFPDRRRRLAGRPYAFTSMVPGHLSHGDRQARHLLRGLGQAADAASMAQSIKATGRAAIYGIYFDSGKAVIKPESEPALAEIAKLLKADPKLKLYVVGHTDNVGAFEYNLKLSMDRADAVVKALVGKHGIAAARLQPFGAGPTSPVESNATEEGRAKNRRVELVEQ